MNTNLTITQTTVLKSASARPDGNIELPVTLRGGARAKVIEGLINKGLAVRAGDSLLITDAGYAAIGVDRSTSEATHSAGTRLQRQNTLSGTNTTFEAPNMGFEQSFNGNRMALRFGLDESSPGAGFTAKFAAFKLDVAYIHNMARERVGICLESTAKA